MKTSEEIKRLTKELEELNPTQEEIFECLNIIFDECETKLDSFITNNTRRPKSFGGSFHIHIGLKGDSYLNVKEAKDFIKWLKENRKIPKNKFNIEEFFMEMKDEIMEKINQEIEKPNKKNSKIEENKRLKEENERLKKGLGFDPEKYKEKILKDFSEEILKKLPKAIDNHLKKKQKGGDRK